MNDMPHPVPAPPAEETSSPAADLTDTHFASLHHAYRTSRERPTDPGVHVENPDLTLRPPYIDHLSPEDLVQVKRNAYIRERMIELTHARQPEAAQKLLQTAWNVLDIDRMTESGQLIIKDFMKSAEAFVHYRTGNTEDAWQTMRASLSYATIILNRYDYPLMDARRVHLGRNLFRLEAHYGDVRRAAPMAAGLIRYLEGEWDAWPFPEAEATSDHREVHPYRENLFAQIARDLALAYIHGTDAQRQTYQQVLSRHIDEAAVSSPRITSLAHWLDLKGALMADELATFADAASTFISVGPVVDGLWHAAVYDAFRLAEAVDLPEACEFQDDVVRDYGSPERIRDLRYRIPGYLDA